MNAQRVYNWMMLLFVTYTIISFNIGITPFENNIVNKEFLPSNNALKYTSASAMLLGMLLWWLIAIGIALSSKVSDPRVLLTKM